MGKVAMSQSAEKVCVEEPALPPLTLQTDVVAVRETGRRTNDTCFTAPALAVTLMNRLAEDGWWRGGRMLEPSAGRGAFVNAENGLAIKPSFVHANDFDPIRVEELRNTVH